LELNVDASLRSRLHDESEEGSWNPESDSVISCQLLKQIEEEDELKDNYGITDNEDNVELEEVQGAFAKFYARENYGYSLEAL
jgi:hypothetical protein